jgi:transporter family-2 protein
MSIMNRWMLAALAGGILLSLQMPLNNRVRLDLGSPFIAALISFSVGVACVALVWAARVGSGQEPLPSGFASIPWWAYLGGACGAAYVTLAIVALPKTGVLLLVACTVLGQQLGALLIDHFGWFGMARQAISWQRISGVVLVMAGTWLAQAR